jgi:hypothetical protein
MNAYKGRINVNPPPPVLGSGWNLIIIIKTSFPELALTIFKAMKEIQKYFTHKQYPKKIQLHVHI